MTHAGRAEQRRSPNRGAVIDPIANIQAFNRGRDPERLALKYAAMRASPFAFLRGSCHLFYARLARAGILKSSPPAWSCGDLHLENFGSYKGDNRLVYFDINDFDEAALAPMSVDPLRLLTSLRVAADGVAIRADDADRLCGIFIGAYAAALQSGKSYWIERETSEGLVRTLLDELRERQRIAFLDGRTILKGRRRVLRLDGRKALPVSDAERLAVTRFMSTFAHTQVRPEFYSVLDVARRIAGTGSLGIERYVVLVKGKGSPDANYLLDLKRALPSTLAAWSACPQPAWASEAARVVAIQRRMQAVSSAFLHAVSIDAAPFVLRALQPSEDRVTLRAARQSEQELGRLVGSMGRLVAWAQIRSSGRQGSADADLLVEVGGKLKWRDKLLEASKACAVQVGSDARRFDEAYDAGAFEAGIR